MCNLLIHPVFVIDIELILESVPPVILIRQNLHTFLEISCQESLSNIEALKLRDCIKLLLSFVASILKRLILLLYPLYFSLDLLLPLGLLSLPPFVIALLVLPDLVQLVLFLDFESCLLDGLTEQNVQDWLHFDVVVEEVVVLDLSDLVDACLLGHVFWSRRFRLEDVSLQFHFCFIWLHFALLSQEIREIDLNPCWWTRSQVVRTGCIFGFFEFHQLRLDHFNFLFLTLFLNAKLLFLGWGQFLAKNIQIVCITSENSLIIHNIECIAAIFLLWNCRVHHTVFCTTVLVLASNHLRLRTFKTLRHIF